MYRNVKKHGLVSSRGSEGVHLGSWLIAVSPTSTELIKFLKHLKFRPTTTLNQTLDNPPLDNPNHIKALLHAVGDNGGN